MAENAARMTAVLQQRAGNDGQSTEDFTSIARAFVYGGAQPGTKTLTKDAAQQHEVGTDSEYEPDPSEKAAEEEDRALDEEERNRANQVIRNYICYFMYRLQCSLHTDVFCCFSGGSRWFYRTTKEEAAFD